MDCEKFDRVVLDLLYEELDELTNAAAKRHMEHCARCRAIGSGLRATREVGILPMLSPPDELEAKILAAERGAHAVLPLRQRVGRAISVMAGYAMRPQLAMAALLLLMIGSSLLFLRATPGDREAVTVTERGVPEGEGETVSLAAETPAPEATGALAHGAVPGGSETRQQASAEAPSKDETAQDKSDDQPAADEGNEGEKLAEAPDFDSAMKAYQAGRYAEAERRFDTVAASGSDKAASAALYAAQSSRYGSGCAAAASRFESVSLKHRGSGIGNEATWQAADCYRYLGQTDRARRHYEALLNVVGYGDRARRALEALDNGGGEAIAARKAKPKAAAPPPATTAPAAKAKPAEAVESPQAAPPADQNKAGY